MSLVKVEFESSTPESMSDEHIAELVKKYKHEKHRNKHTSETTEGHTKRDIIESIDQRYELSQEA